MNDREIAINRLLRKVFWDRNVEYSVWRERVLEGHPSYLPQSIAIMTPREFAGMLGVQVFMEHWPSMRTMIPKDIRHHVHAFNLAWDIKHKEQDALHHE